MALGPSLRSTADKLVTQFGQAMTVRKPGGVPDPDNDTVTGGDTDYAVTGVIEDYKAYEVRGLIQERDKRILIPASRFPANVEPLAGWLVITESVTYRIIYAQRTSIETSGVVWTITGRQ